MTNSHAAWAHLVGASNALQDIAADASVPAYLRSQLSTIEAKAGTSNKLTKYDMKIIGQCLIHLGENAGNRQAF